MLAALAILGILIALWASVTLINTLFDKGTNRIDRRLREKQQRRSDRER